MRELFNRIQQKIADHFLIPDYMEFHRKLTDREKREIYDYVNGKKYMSRYPESKHGKRRGLSEIEVKKRKPDGVYGKQGSFVE